MLTATLIALMTLLGSARADADEVVVTGEPPIVSLGLVNAQTVGLTDQSTVSALIQLNVATDVTCTLDGQPISCGTPPPTCPAASCELFTASALVPGEHDLVVKTSDGAYGFYGFDINTTPPDTDLLTLNDGVDPRPLDPQFTFQVDNPGDPDLGGTVGPPYTPDSAQCAMTPLGSPPSWEPCPKYLPGGEFEGFKFRASVPAKHIDYLFQARGVDPLGRVDPTPVSMLYDPVPCAVTVRAPRTKAALLSHGVTVVLQCTGQLSVRVYLLLVKRNGRRIHAALPLAGPVAVPTAAGAHTYQRRVRVHVPLLLTGGRSYTIEATAISAMIPGSTHFTVSAHSRSGAGGGRSRAGGQR